MLTWLHSHKLKSSDPRARRAAVERLASEGVRAAPRLAPLVSDPDADVRLAVVEALARIPHMTALRAVLGATGDDDAAVRQAAQKCLSQLDSGPFEKLLQTERGPIVAAMLEVARKVPPDVAPSLLESAGRMGANEAVEPLICMLESATPSTRAAAIRALGDVLLNVGSDASSLIASALRPLLGDHDLAVQVWAAVTLATGTDDTHARHLLLEFAHAPTAAAEGVLSGATADVPRSVRLDAIRALGRLKDPATRAVLLGILRDQDGEVRAAACEALGACGDGRTVDVLRKVQANDADAAVRTKAQAAIADIRRRTGGTGETPPPLQPS